MCNPQARRCIPEELKGRRREVVPRGFRGGASGEGPRRRREPLRVISSSEADKENVPPSLSRYSNVRRVHQCSIDDELTDDGEQVRFIS